LNGPKEVHPKRAQEITTRHVLGAILSHEEKKKLLRGMKTGGRVAREKSKGGLGKKQCRSLSCQKFKGRTG